MQLDEYVLYTTKYLINTEEEKRREEKKRGVNPVGLPKDLSLDMILGNILSTRNS